LGPDDAAAREGEADGGGGFAGEDPDAARRERDAANRAADAEDDGAVARGELRGGDARDGDAADLQAVVGVVPGDPIGAAVAAEHGEDARRERDREWDAVGLGLADERSLLGVGDLDRRVPARRRSAGLVHPRRLDEGDPAGGQREVERRDAVEQRRRLAVGDDLDPASRDRLLAGASRGATERIDVLDLDLRVGERRAAADDVAEPPAGAVALVGEPVDLYLATAELRLHHVVVRNRAVLVQRPEGGRRAGGERDLRLADRQIPVAGHARGRRLRQDLRPVRLEDMDDVALAAVPGEPRYEAAVLGDRVDGGGAVAQRLRLAGRSRSDAGNGEQPHGCEQDAHRWHVSRAL